MKKNLLLAAMVMLASVPAAAQMAIPAVVLKPGLEVPFGSSLLSSVDGPRTLDSSNAAPLSAATGLRAGSASQLLADPQQWQLSLTVGKPKKTGDVDWMGLIRDQIRVDGIQHLIRLTTEPHTRERVTHTRYLDGYVQAVRGYFTGRPRWEDGDPYVGNNVNHPLAGAISSHNYTNNDRRCRNTQYGDPEYWRCLTRATIFSVVASVNWEWNPLMSESALGNVGRYHTCVKGRCVGDGGWSDFVMTPVGGAGIRLAGDIARARLWPVLDRHLSGNIAARALKAVLKIATDPGRMAACALSADFRGALSTRLVPGRR